jgi:hypothetical protein
MVQRSVEGARDAGRSVYLVFESAFGAPRGGDFGPDLPLVGSPAVAGREA